MSSIGLIICFTLYLNFFSINIDFDTLVSVLALAQNISNHTKFISRTDSEVSIAALYSILNTLGSIQSIPFRVLKSTTPSLQIKLVVFMTPMFCRMGRLL